MTLRPASLATHAVVAATSARTTFKRVASLVPCRFFTTSKVLSNKTVNIQIDSKFDLHRIDPDNGPPTSVEISHEKLKKIYRDMALMRRMEIAADQLYKQKLIRGFCHLNSGQEAVSVGVENSITRDDAIITAYRCHGFVMMRGASVKSILGELMGRKIGVTKGKGGSMHMFAHNFYGGNGIVGAQVPLGAGIAFAQKYRGEKAVTMALYGDGAANQGQVFEAYNMAALWNLPCIFACENNHYGMGTAANRAAKSVDYYSRGDYIPGVRVDGMNVLAVLAATTWAREYVLANGPLVFEYNTYRYGGHSMSDPGTTYRTRDEIGRIRSERDPINSFKRILLEHSVVSDESEFAPVDAGIKQEVDEAIAECNASTEPDIKELYTEIYVAGTEPATVRGLEPEQIHHY